jgi:hypothetical protein
LIALRKHRYEVAVSGFGRANDKIARQRLFVSRSHMARRSVDGEHGNEVMFQRDDVSQIFPRLAATTISSIEIAEIGARWAAMPQQSPGVLTPDQVSRRRAKDHLL